MITEKEARARSGAARDKIAAQEKKDREQKTQRLLAMMSPLIEKTLAEIEAIINSAVETGAYAVEFPVPAVTNFNAHDREFYRAELLLPMREAGFNAGFKMEQRPSGSDILIIRWDG